jgi:hypothetical protein
VTPPHAPSSAPLRKRPAEGYERFEDDSLPTLRLEEELVLLDGRVEAKPDLRACRMDALAPWLVESIERAAAAPPP